MLPSWTLPSSSARSFLYLICGLTLFTSLTFNFIYTTIHLSSWSRTTSTITTIAGTSLEGEDALNQELSLQLLYHACQTLLDPTDCRVRQACHWCPYGGVLDETRTTTRTRRGTTRFPCVPARHACHNKPNNNNNNNDDVHPVHQARAAVLRRADLPANAVADLANFQYPQPIQTPSRVQENVTDETNANLDDDFDNVKPKPKTGVAITHQTKRYHKKYPQGPGHYQVDVTGAAKRNQARQEARVAEFRALSPAQRAALLVKPQDRYYRGRYFAPIVNMEHKLVFITIPKVACTQWLQLFRRMEGLKDWRQRVGGLPYTPEVNGLRYLADFTLAQANEIMTSPEYTRAVFVRDPKERFLSAYLDKVVNTQHIVLGACCRTTRDCATAQTTFAEFYNLTAVCDNEHWGVQSERVPDKIWQSVNFVGYMDTLQQDAQRLLQRVGAWDTYGATGWGPDGTQAMFAEEAGESTNHATRAQERMRHYYTPDIERGIEKRYRDDYQNDVFKLPRRRLFTTTTRTTTQRKH